MRNEPRAIRAALRARGVLLATLGGLAIGGALRLSGSADLASAIWGGTIVIALAPLAVSTAHALRRGALGVDLIALLAMAGALALGETLAGAVIALMLSGGQALEAYAGARARRDLSTLARMAPHLAHRCDPEGLATIPVETVTAGDPLLVKSGEVVPVDGVVDAEIAILDEATLSGEARPVERRRGDPALSGAINAGNAFRMRATRAAADSTYTHIVRLVEAAHASKAPLARLADRYALYFLALTLSAAAIAWALSGDPRRALAVLVVATPCPLILAAPIAIVSGISRAARRGVVIKGGAALETLARARILLLDKTGTLTTGKPAVWDVETLAATDSDEVVRFAASLDQMSAHVLASAIVRTARERGLVLTLPSAVVEEPGTGIRGIVDGKLVAVGKRSWVESGAPESARARRIRRRASLEGSTNVFVAIDGVLAGAILIEDPIRADAARTVRKLRGAGFTEVIMLTGDRADLAETVGAAIGADAVFAERSPIDKVDAVRTARARGTTVMVGDGINDAPALAAADVGVALGARGATASSETSDVVLLVDRLDRLVDAVSIARRSRRIAVESILAGIALSLVAMAFAAAGRLAPLAGALVQEAIDVAVILNALRALGGGRAPARDAHGAALGARFRREHRELWPDVDRIRRVADRLDEMSPEARDAALEEVRRFLVERLIPHEREEDARMYPVVAKVLGGEDPTGTMTRAHVEIAHLSRLFVRQLEAMAGDGPAPEDLRDLRRILYGLYAVLRLHFAQEEEAYLSYVEERLEPVAAARGVAFVAALAVSLGSIVSIGSAASAAPSGVLSDRTCWDCHESHSVSAEIASTGLSAARVDSVRLTSALYELSAHAEAGLACVACHAGIEAIPHPADLPPVSCAACHDAQSAEHASSIHGQERTEGNADAPGCADCHGTHAVLRAADRASPTHKLSQTATCARCHADPAVAARNEIGMPAPLDAYAAGVHGEALLIDENESAPACADCHGAHDIRRATEPTSRVAKSHVPGTCGHCHGEIALVFGESVHGRAVAEGNPDAPACNDCHGEHRIEPVASRTSLVYPDNLVRTTCVRCHESEVLAQRYGFPADRGATFRETYHGLAGALGGLPVANCASCHGVHDIFPSSDPRSTIAPGNLQSTCGRCHPSASEEFTHIAVHELATVVPRHPVTRTTRSVYITLLVVVIGGMGLHNLLVWGSLVARKRAREKAEPRVARFSRFEAVEHMLLIVSFFGLAITGFALKYSDAFWVRWLARLGLDEAMRSDLHRALGVMLIVISLSHGIFLVATRRGRADLRALRPRRADVAEFIGTIRYDLGLAAGKPRARRFDYAEKLEYLALLWGTAVMILTGLALWYPANVTRWAPAWLVEVAEVVHFYEAWLAFLAILVWHLFFVVFHPEEAPLNTTFFDGKTTLEKARRRDESSG